MTKKPNFFIVGAPKSGTTSLYAYLKQHPDVYLPKKELYYFCYDLTFRTPPFSEDIYLSYYADAVSQKALGDASVYYLLSQHASQQIKEFNPESKIIIMLREPVEMAYSLHSQLLSNGDETIADFDEALKAEEFRIKGEMVPTQHKCPREAFYYTKVAAYYEQVKRYKDVFDEKNVHVILFDDFVKNTKEEYIKLLKFLGIDTILPESFEKVNPNKVAKSKAMLNFLVNPPGIVKSIGRALFPHHSKRREWVLDKIWAMNTRYTEREAISNDAKEKLKLAYRGDIEKLQALLNKDLTNWLN